jgi:uncharacterized protein YxeA
MKKVLLILVLGACALCLCISVGGYLLYQSGNFNSLVQQGMQNANNNSTNEDNTDQSELAGPNSNYEDYLTSGAEVTCEWSDTSSTDNMMGSVYISNGRMRQEYSSDTQSGSILFVNDTVYIWSDQETTGVKYLVEDIVGELDSNSTSLDGNFNFQEGYTFSCEEGSVSEAQFRVPSNIEFTDLDALTDQYQNMNIEDYYYDEAP